MQEVRTYNQLIKYIEAIIERDQYKWCEKTEEFVNGLLTGLEAGYSLRGQKPLEDKYLLENTSEEEE